eukprot:960375-Pyramimonas_sp.AAC.1
MKIPEAQEHKAGRVLKGRHIYWTILQPYKVTDVDDMMHDFKRPQLIRMRGDDLQRFILDWDNLLLGCLGPPGNNTLQSLFRAQIRRRPWMKKDMRDYDKMSM